MAYRDIVALDSPYIYLPYTNNNNATNLGSKIGLTVASTTGVTWGTGIVDQAPIFNGTSSVIRYNLGTDAFYNGGVWSIEVWFKRNAPTTWSNMVHREEGTNLVTLRLDSPSAGSANQLTLDMKAAGSRITINGPAITDANWHHAVATSDGTTARIYLDGVEVASGATFTNQTFSTSPIRVGAYGDSANSENWSGQMDEIALYRTVLSASRISAHYGNSLVIATPATMSAVALMPVASTEKDAAVTVGAATVDLTAPNAVVNFDTAPKAYGPYSYSGYWQQILDGGTGQYFASDPARVMQQSVAKHGASFSIPSSEVSKTSKVMLKLTMYPTTNAGGAHNVTVSQVEKEPGIWHQHIFMNPVTVQYPPAAASESNTREFDITPIVKSWDAGGPKHGLAIDMRQGPGSVNWVVSDYTVEIYLPTKVVTYSADPFTGSLTITDVVVTAVQDARINVGSASVNALMLAPTAETVDSVSFSVSPMTASAYIVNPVIPNAKVEVEPMAISGLINNPLTVAGTGVTVSTEASTANALMNNALASNRTDAVINAEFMRASAVLKDTVQSADPRLHPYWQRINTQVDADDRWYAFIEKSGPWFIDELRYRADPSGTDKDLTGNVAWKYFGEPSIGTTEGPAGRPATYFDGIDDHMVVGDENDSTPTPTFTYEFVIKTTKKNQIISVGSEFLPNYNVPRKDVVEMVDGRVVITHHVGDTITREFVKGLKDVADGNWHHIVITNWWYDPTDRRDYPPFGQRAGMGIWIDGKLDRRSYAPDYIGADSGILTNPDVIGRGTNSTNYFEGYMSMFVARRGYSMAKYDIEQNYYLALEVNPVRVGPLQATAVMPDAKAKGNTIRVLYLRHKPNNNPGFINEGTSYQAAVGQDVGFTATTARLTDYRLTSKQTFGLNRWYRDPITDEFRLIDLKTDLDVASFDMIYIEDSIQDSISYLAASLQTTPQRAKTIADNFYDSVRWAVAEKGVELYIDDAQIAKEIGFIDDYEMHLPVYETDLSPEAERTRPGAGRLGSPWVGQYDYWAWKNDPWRVADGNVPPYHYYDTHYLSGERIVATVPGLTDTPGYTLAEAIDQAQADPFGDWPWALRYDPNETGLKLGQEMLFMNREYVIGSAEYLRAARYTPVVSIPSEFINVGTVIAKEMANDWIREQRPANPYADNATTIIIKEGDLINGVPTKGRVAIAPNSDWFAPGLIPIGIPLETDTPEQKKWQTSSHRQGRGSYMVIGENGQVISNPAIPQQPVPGHPPEPPRSGGMWFVWQPDPMATQKVPNGDMGFRLYRWLIADKLEVGEGDVNIATNAMTASASLIAPTSDASRSVTIRSEAMLASAQLVGVAGANRDATYHAFPMTATAMMNERVTRIVVPPMTATAEMVAPNFDDLFESGDLVSLTLNKTEGRTIVVYIRSDKS